ncbi:host cell division inhibitor Icd-like protein [Xenorhabdus bovienii]|uniref:host cell division inhibitor Icd-like protein n=1 Tax=Xenorhabdus bovienii TaxID=40576 RepID=UPI00237C8D12|nr:host cell division inhibitor Icd-like protein [Xenorhabdus bovienii]MDE1493022.1 host cell division inhibitor Icd-like protein [Xenorhabdus bovienii]
MKTFIFAAIERANKEQEHPTKIKCVAESYHQAKAMLSGEYITAWAGQIINHGN